MARQKLIWLLAAAILSFLIAIYITSSFSADVSIPMSSSFTENDPRLTRKFKNVIVHLDMKGAPPRVEFLEKFFKVLENHYVDGVLIEYEDMFPFEGRIEKIRRDVHYSEEDVRRIIESAGKHGLEVIPLIQTFGHMEFVLKQQFASSLSEDLEDYNTICISDPKSIDLIREMIHQIRRLHPNSTRIHIGADEAYHIAEDERCQHKMASENWQKSELKMRHIAKIGKIAKEAGFETVFAWNDMFDKESGELIKEARIPDFITPVVWGYREDVTEPGYFPDGLFDRLANVFDDVYMASAFKGADGTRQQFSNISRYLETQKSYVKLTDSHPKIREKTRGIFVTGWSRYSHYNPLCELLPVAIPSLIADLHYLNWQYTKRQVWREIKSSLKCGHPKHLDGIMVEWALKDCKFHGVDVFEVVMNDWKRLVTQRTLGKHHGKEDIVSVLDKLTTALKPVLYKKDIDEVESQYLQDYHSIQRAPTNAA